MDVKKNIGKVVPNLTEDRYFEPSFVINTAKQVYLWQIHNKRAGNSNNGWARSVFYIGAFAAYKALNDPLYQEDCLAWGVSNRWQAGDRPRHADEHACGQVYTESYMQLGEEEMIDHIQQRIDAMIMSPRRGREDWHWCDALFMAPPTIARLGYITGDTIYFNFLTTMWADVTDYLYSAEDYLFYRDIRYTEITTNEGNRVFWSRGNGWVIAGAVRVLQYLPEDHPYRPSLVELFVQMAYRIKALQRTDGL